VVHDTTPLYSCISGIDHFNSVYADCHDYQNGARPEQLSLLGYLVNSCSDAPTPPPAPLPPAPIPSQYLVNATVYRERAAGTSLDLANRNAASILGAMLFMLVDMAGANQTTPSGEADPSTALLTQFQVQYDSRTTGYASCDQVVGSVQFRCRCIHERQLNRSIACGFDAVGLVDLKPYYQAVGSVGSTAFDNGSTTYSDHRPLTSRHGIPPPRLHNVHQITTDKTDNQGCNWYDDNRCQINLGKKLSMGAGG
jgi:hypothetical protein